MKYRYAQLLVLLSGAVLNAGVVKAEPASRTALNSPLERSVLGQNKTESQLLTGDAAHPESSVPGLPPPQVELDVVSILANFPHAERRYVQLILHTVKDLRLLSEQCARQAAAHAPPDLRDQKLSQDFDLADVSRYGQTYLSYFNPVRQHLLRAYRRLESAQPPARFQQAHRYFLDYLAFGLENWGSKNQGPKASTKPAHDPAELWRICTLTCRTYKKNGLDVSIYLLN